MVGTKLGILEFNNCVTKQRQLSNNRILNGDMWVMAGLSRPVVINIKGGMYKAMVAILRYTLLWCKGCIWYA